MNEFREIWCELEKDSVDGKVNGILRRRIFPNSAFNLFLAFQIQKRQRMLHIKVTLSSATKLKSPPQSKGFEVKIVVFPDDRENQVTIELVLTSPQYEDIFDTLIGDILNYITLQKDENLMVNSFLDRLLKWQHFLDRHGSDGLSEEMQKGLYGELWCLRKYLIPSKGLNKALSSWEGPYKSNHDFEFENKAIEMKVTTSKNQQKIMISNELQLDDKGLNALFLVHLSLNEVSGSGETLNEIVHFLRGMCTADVESMNLLEKGLFNSGYLDTHVEKYNSKGFIERSQNIFTVKNGFPRIVENDLMNGVGDVKYSINISECMHHQVDESLFLPAIRREVDDI
ncbi:hypothetical protein BGV40_08715 [Methanosarcina sp. Ant1]|nr:hypothetical protein BGV40_08715 [Methanosarcina sp. Ant1]